MSEPSILSPLASALGRVPTGLYIVSTKTPEGPLGFVASFLIQVGLAPPSIAVAIGRNRDHLTAIRAAGHFGVSILDGPSQRLMGAFFKKYEADRGPFDELETRVAPGGSSVLTEALAWFECRVTGEHENGDHVVLFGEVVAGEQLREGDPAVHLRKNGLGY